MNVARLDSDEYPRVLVVGAASMNASSATGVTLMNLFSGWPLDRLAQIHASIPPDPSICSNSRAFTSDDIPLVRTAKSLLRRNSPSGFISKAQSPIAGPHPLGILGAAGDIARIKLSPDLLCWAQAFQPQIIHSVLGSVRMMNLALQLSRRFSAPIVPHFMDDWPRTAYRTGALMKVPRRILQSKLRQVLELAPIRLTIGQDMANEYARRYGGHFDSFMNCVEGGERFRCAAYEARGAFKFAYVGGLHLNRWRSLLDVTAALQEIYDSEGGIAFDIFAPQRDIQIYGDQFRAYSVVGEINSLSPSRIQEKLCEFDSLIHIESFLEEDSRYTRLSVSTKIPQYMASGRPILAYGPGSLSSIRYVEKVGAGLAVTVNGDRARIRAEARRLMSSVDLRKKLGSRGYEAASTFHNAEIERVRFRAALNLSLNGRTNAISDRFFGVPSLKN